MSTIPSDLPGPVDFPTGPTLEVPTSDEGAHVVSPGISADSLVGLPTLSEPPVVPTTGEAVLSIEAPWNVDVFDASIPGCPRVLRNGSLVPSQFVDQVISIGAANGVTIVKR